MLIILILAPLAASVPLAALAAILFVVAYNMSEIKHFSHMLRCAPRADVAILLITFGLTVFTDLVVAVNIGVILATLQFLRRMASSVEVQQVAEKELEMELTYQGLTTLPPGVLVYAIEGPFFFGAVEDFEQTLAQTHTDPRILVIRLRRVPFMDITGLQTLEEAIFNLEARGIRIILCEANERVREKLDKAGILATIDHDDYFDDFAAAIARCNLLVGIDPHMSQEKRVVLSEYTESMLKTSELYLRDVLE